MTMPVRKVVQKVRNLLITDGWCQGDYVNHKGQYCLVGALEASTSSYYLRNSFHKRVETLINLNKHEENENWAWDNIIEWNDDSGRTKRQVLALLKKADY